MDRGYLDFRALCLHDEPAFLLYAPNPILERRYSHPVDRTTGVLSDQTVMLTVFYSTKAYPETLRASFFDAERSKRIKFLTNNFALPARKCRHLQATLAGRVVLQMDQAASAYQSLLGHQRERREDPNLDRGVDLCAGSDRAQAARSGS